MNEHRLKEMLDQVAGGTLSPDQARTALKDIAFENIDYAYIDHHRSLRKGFPEVIFGQGKTEEQIIGIVKAMVKNEEPILVTRIDHQKAESVLTEFPGAEYDRDAKMLLLKTRDPEIRSKGEILVITAGTSDIPVAKEAVITARAMGNRVKSIFDVGVAGIHRLFAHKRQIQEASVLIVVAGMEGALPSVVAGMVRAPVIAVPTSVGYGTSFGGMTALLSMLNSCSSNVAVVNIDNGFGGGFMASTINQMPNNLK